MRDPMEDYEIEALESAGLEIEFPPEDRERLEGALDDALGIFAAPADADPDRVLLVIEALEDAPPYFSDTRISDQIGEAIELLHEACKEALLDFEDAQEGKRITEAVAQALGIGLSHPDHGTNSFEGGGVWDETL